MIPDWVLQALPSLPVFAVLAGATFAGCLMRGFTGFGAGLLMAPIFSLLMPATTVLVVILLLTLRSEEHTSELQSLMRISYAVFCLKKKINTKQHRTHIPSQSI